LIFADVIHSGDVGVIESRGSPSLVHESLGRLGGGEDRSGDEFQSYNPAETGVSGLVDFTHAAGVQKFEDPICTELVTGPEPHLCRTLGN
jgi:hypothetical protein